MLAGILVIALFVGMAGGDISKLGGESKVLMGLVALIGIVVFFLALNAVGIAIDSQIVATLFFLLVVIVTVAMVAK